MFGIVNNVSFMKSSRTVCIFPKKGGVSVILNFGLGSEEN